MRIALRISNVFVRSRGGVSLRVHVTVDKYRSSLILRLKKFLLFDEQGMSLDLCCFALCSAKLTIDFGNRTRHARPSTLTVWGT